MQQPRDRFLKFQIVNIRRKCGVHTKDAFIWKKPFLGILVAFFVGNILVLTPRPALGIEYPIRHVEIICPWTAGSSMDLTARLVAEIAKKHLGQAMVVMNKPGASGTVAAVDVINSRPDGYKVLIATNLFFALTVKTQAISYDPSVLVPIANVMEYKIGMIVKGDSPWKTFHDLLDYSKKNPGELKWAHPGRGVIHHLDGMAVFKKAGVDTYDIPYKGSPEMIVAVLGGQVNAATLPFGAAKGLMKSGKIRYLITFSERRYPDLPDVPSAVELGFTEAGNLTTYTGFYVHKDTPEGIKKTLFDIFKKSFEDPEYKKGIENIGEAPRFGDSQFMKDAIRKSAEVGIPLLKNLGLYVD